MKTIELVSSEGESAGTANIDDAFWDSNQADITAVAHSHGFTVEVISHDIAPYPDAHVRDHASFRQFVISSEREEE